MIWVRSFIFLLGQVVSAIVVETATLVSYLIPGCNRDAIIRSWGKFNIWTLRIICRLDYRVKGLENIPNRPAIVIANHQSAWETLSFQMFLPPTSSIVKRQLLWIPIFGWGLKATQPIAIDRSKKVESLKQLVKQGQERLTNGRWLIVYPEGTRMALGSPGAFQSGGAMIASKTGAPIVPIAHNSGLFWARKSFLKYPGTVDVVIGPVISPEGKSVRGLNDEVEQWVKAQMASLPQTR